MSGHGRSVFVNSCIKKPLSPSSKRPNPSFLVPQCSLDRGLQDPRAQDAMGTITRKKATSKCPLARNGNYRRTRCCSLTHQLRKETDNFQTMVQFYDSIPDYNDLLHLPREEFYCRLNTLKKKQRELKSICCTTKMDVKNSFRTHHDTNKRSESEELENYCYNGPAANPTAGTQHNAEDDGGVGTREKERSDQSTDDGDSLHSWSKSPPTVVDMAEAGSKPSGVPRKGSGKSVRIDSNKEDNLSNGLGESSRRYRSGTPYVSDPDESATTSATTKNASPCATPINSDFMERYDRYVKRNLRCKSASPIRNLANITVPQPYKMTQREEEQRTAQELLLSSKNAFPSGETLPESTTKTQFRAHPVPITSRIPLFDTIMADQDYRNRLAKLNSEIELQSQMKPFQFSERLNREHSRCLSRSLSSPALLGTGLTGGLEGLQSRAVRPFKAKPCPKKLFSNYFYTKAWEDEYFRHLNKRLRAEEMLRQAQLPPSMARRERTERKNCLSRHSGTTNEDVAKERPESGGGKKSKRKRKLRKSGKRRKSIEEKCAEYFASVSDPNGIPYPISNSSCSTENNRGSGDTPSPIYPVNRPNLAATLRTEWCRKKLRELELDEVTADKKLAPRFRWGVKKSQAFQNLNLDHTHQEELNLRLATRRAEQRLRQEEHAINMELMRQRVKAAPLLLEGPPQWGPRLGHVAHRCSSLNRDPDNGLLRKPDKLSKLLQLKPSTSTGGGGTGKKCDSPSTSCTATSSSGHSRTGGPTRKQRTAEKRRNNANGSKLSSYSFDSTAKHSFKACDSEVLSLSDV
ncbi:uncharacterized protein LOC128274083 [Anopheles cruzii]|uniref:uncharacterized protein LOC128274083 n=1 Tax=Anopheles cruzii TaxID=68878 RepID=UPI0022EC77BF|nr:uncharacterized protein LOC128274083 [Anopheles cruzii]